MQKTRNPYALHAKRRRAEVFKDKRLKRIRNKEQKDLEEQKERLDDKDPNLYNSNHREE